MTFTAKIIDGLFFFPQGKTKLARTSRRSTPSCRRAVCHTCVKFSKRTTGRTGCPSKRSSVTSFPARSRLACWQLSSAWPTALPTLPSGCTTAWQAQAPMTKLSSGRSFRGLSATWETSKLPSRRNTAKASKVSLRYAWFVLSHWMLFTTYNLDFSGRLLWRLQKDADRLSHCQLKKLQYAYH